MEKFFKGITWRRTCVRSDAERRQQQLVDSEVVLWTSEMELNPLF